MDKHVAIEMWIHRTGSVLVHQEPYGAGLHSIPDQWYNIWRAMPSEDWTFLGNLVATICDVTGRNPAVALHLAIQLMWPEGRFGLDPTTAEWNAASDELRYCRRSGVWGLFASTTIPVVGRYVEEVESQHGVGFWMNYLDVDTGTFDRSRCRQDFRNWDSTQNEGGSNDTE